MSALSTPESGATHAAACILCDSNCGLNITLEGRTLARIMGNKDHPSSQGYTCQKAIRLDYYQNHGDRLNSPLRKTSDGGFEKISWETAISEIAAKLVAIRDTHGGHTLAYYGGGGQGNHTQGAHGGSLRKAMGTRYIYTALAQEKTGDFWVHGQLFGRQDCHITPDQIEHSDYVLFLGTNPWQAHGFPRARLVLKELAADKNRTMVVVDPRRTKTAEMADLHIAVKPGRDAFLMSAILAVIVQENLFDQEFLAKRTSGSEEILKIFGAMDAEKYALHAGSDITTVQQVARGLSSAKRAVVRHDLGLEQSLHSTLNTYLDKLLFLLTGNFGREGTNVLHTSLGPIIGHSAPDKDGEYSWRTKVQGMKPIAALYPPNILPGEIDTDHPERIRGLVVDSSNPANTGADSHAYKKAFEKLELLVTIDVALSETAQLSDYVLPAASQFEKWEATFFNFGFPTNFFHVRRPLLPRLEGTLPESEIYRRLVTAMGERAAEPMDKFGDKLDEEARLTLAPIYLSARRYASVNKAAVLRAGIETKAGQTLGDALFEKIIDSPAGTNISTHLFEDQWEMIKHKDGLIHLVIPELLEWLAELPGEMESDRTPTNEDFPLILAAGERRDYNANQIYRNPDWRKKDKDGALRIHPADAESYGLTDGGFALCETKSGAVQAQVSFDPSLSPGFVALPHGYGMEYPGQSEGDERRVSGPRINFLTSAQDCDPLAKTPYHKTVPVRVKALALPAHMSPQARTSVSEPEDARASLPS